MAMFLFGLISVSVAPLRLAPSHQSEQVSQLLFGERITVLSQPKGKWIQVRNDWDDYEGWILRTQFVEITAAVHRKHLLFYAAGTNDQLFFPEDDGIVRLNPGSDLFLLKRNEIKWPHCQFVFKGKKLNKKDAVYSDTNLHYWVKTFLGTPYVWGGRSLSGMDCSGFSQIIFKLLGYQLPRDASQQAMVGEMLHFLQDARCGDLAFFENKEEKINHVGIMLDNHTIAHATESAGRIVIDAIDAEGIISTIHKVRTHKLRFVKRYF